MNYQAVCNECKIQTLPRGTELPSALMAFELEELQCFVTELSESWAGMYVCVLMRPLRRDKIDAAENG